MQMPFKNCSNLLNELQHSHQFMQCKLCLPAAAFGEQWFSLSQSKRGQGASLCMWKRNWCWQRIGPWNPGALEKKTHIRRTVTIIAQHAVWQTWSCMTQMMGMKMFHSLFFSSLANEAFTPLNWSKSQTQVVLCRLAEYWGYKLCPVTLNREVFKVLPGRSWHDPITCEICS